MMAECRHVAWMLMLGGQTIRPASDLEESPAEREYTMR